MLELSGKMELSEKILRLEELVREQAGIIEQLEGSGDGEHKAKIRQRTTDSMSNWSIPNSISSSMVANSSSLILDRDVTARNNGNRPA